MIIEFIEEFEILEDTRYENFVRYPLDEILLTVLVSTICGAEDFEDIELIGIEKLDFLRRYRPFENGIAAPKTFWRVLDMLDPKAFAACFSAWVARLIGPVSGVVAIDGKALCGTSDAERPRGIHMISAYAHAAGLALGQVAVSDKSNEITAIPELLDLLSIKGTTVTIDAMGCQSKIAAAILDKKADYILALKGNQSTLHDDVQRFFNDPTVAAECKTATTQDSDHGRIEERTIRVSDQIDWLRQMHPHWLGLCTIAAVTSTRIIKKTGRKSTETRYYIASLKPDPDRFLSDIRAHWSIENNLHWMLDVALHEDQAKTRKKNAALNQSVIRKMALGMLKRENSKMAIKRKMKKAICNNNFLTLILS